MIKKRKGMNYKKASAAGKKAAETKIKKAVRFSKIRFFKTIYERIEKSHYQSIPHRIRGIYALLKKENNNFNVVYIGMSTTGISSRIRRHLKSKRKKDLWSHFTIFEVYNNIYDNEIKELEGLFREIYRKDKRANILNKQKKFKPFKKIKKTF